MSGAALPPVLYRIVKGNQPSLDDFASAMMLGRPPRLIERREPAAWTGLSMFDSAARAGEKAREFPKIGAYIATVVLRDTRRVVWHKTLGPGHYTVWGRPEEFMPAVTSVEPAGRGEGVR